MPEPTLLKSDVQEDLARILLTIVQSYTGDRRDIAALDVMAALGSVGVAIMYQDAVLHPIPLLTEQQFSSSAQLGADRLMTGLADLMPAMQMIALTAALAYAAQAHITEINRQLLEFMPGIETPIGGITE